MSKPCGYAWIAEQAQAPDFLGSHKARLADVNSLQRLPEGALLVPARLLPAATWLAQALFAIKHEGVRLDYLAVALQRVSDDEMRDLYQSTPNGTYVRKLCFLWEAFKRRHIDGVVDTHVSAAYVKMFDANEVITGSSSRHPRWRIDFNGLGNLSFCPLVRKTTVIAQALERNLQADIHTFAQSIGQKLLDRALSWAYLSETEGSYAIEGEIPNQDKAALFARLLQRAHDQRQLTEDYLIELQNAVVSNPFDQAVQFRIEQNRLQGSALGAVGVTYVPPEPELSAELMEHLMAFANQPPVGINAWIHAALVSFAFVFIHPFMDGNGRLSRFMIHHCLGQSGTLPVGFLLPISVAMKKHEDDYLQALTAFSKPARTLCDVRWLGDEQYEFYWKPNADIWFRYMDISQGVAFVLQMAEKALDLHLKDEINFLQLFDEVSNHIQARYDLRSSDLSTLIITIYQQEGKLSNNRRKRFADRVPSATLDAIEIAVAKRMRNEPLCSQDEGD